MWKIKLETKQELDLGRFGFEYNKFLDTWDDVGTADPLTRIYKVVEYVKPWKENISKFVAYKAEHVSNLLPCLK